MKVGIVHGSFETLGGSEKVVISLIKILKDKGHDVDLYFTNKIDDYILNQTFGNLLSDVHVHKVFQLRMKVFGIYKSLLNRMLLTRAANKDDIVIETRGSLDPRWFTNKPYFVYCNGVNINTLNENKQWNSKSLYRFLYSILDARLRDNIKNVTIISNSQYTKNLIKKLLNVDSAIIYPPVETDIFKCQDNRKELRIVVFGRFSPEKNYELAIDLAELCDAQFAFVGNIGDSKYYNKLIQLIRRRNIKKGIKIIPNASINDLAQILISSKIYLHCRYDEPFGITVIEAISAGCIPIVPNCSAHVETVPFKELRFSNISEASEKIQNALRGNYDHLLPKLQEHIKQFDEKSFQNKILELLENFSTIKSTNTKQN